MGLNIFPFFLDDLNFMSQDLDELLNKGLPIFHLLETRHLMGATLRGILEKRIKVFQPLSL